MDGDAFWDRWGELTRYLHSARLAFKREAKLWDELEFGDPSGVEINQKGEPWKYHVTVEQHRAVMGGEETLLATVLISSYALAEAAALARLGEESSDAGGIEGWGKRLLERNDQGWDAVLGGRSEVVEVAVVRNYYAHALAAMNEKSISRLRNAGNCRFEVGDTCPIDIESTIRYRHILKDLLRHGGVRKEY